MFRIIDRYIIRELILPFLMGLVVFTFLLMIQPLADYSEQLISKGVSWNIVAKVLVTLIPQALAVTIPIALLIGLLIGFGRLSSDRESVALLACGISIYRLLRPVMVVAVASWAVTSWVMLDAVPRANQAFREIVYGVISARAENEIKPRIFFEDFPNRILYIGDALSGGGWRQVFLADTMKPEEPTVFTAASGQLVINREKRTVDLVLQNGSRHTANLRDPSKYEVARFSELILGLDPDTVFNVTEIMKGENEMTISELRARAAELEKHHERFARAAHRPAPQVLDSLRVHRLRRDRPVAGAAARARRKAGGVRAGHHRRVRLLRDPLYGHADDKGPARAAMARRVGAQHRPRPGRGRGAAVEGPLVGQAHSALDPRAAAVLEAPGPVASRDAGHRRRLRGGGGPARHESRGRHPRAALQSSVGSGCSTAT